MSVAHYERYSQLYECEVSYFNQLFLLMAEVTFCWWAAMVIDALMHALLLKEKDITSRILVSIQAVLHTNNATVGTQNKKKKKSKRSKAFKNKSKPIFWLPLKKEGKRMWIKKQIHQLNTMQKQKEFILKLHRASQERITSPEASQTSQSASIICSKRPIKKGWQPSQSNTHHTKKRRTGRGREQRRNDRNKEGCRRSQSTWKDRTHTWSGEQREWTIHPNVQIL